MMTYNLPNNSICKVQDIFDNIPSWFTPDILFTDPPYNQSLYTNFLNKDDCTNLLSKNNTKNFNDFNKRLFEIITNISPKIVFLEIGKEYLAEYINELKKIYKYVNFYNSYYYNNLKNKCYITHATNIFNVSKFKDIEDLDEKEIIKWICKNIEFDCIGDLCMGKGLVGKYAFLNNKKFVGIELNKKRLALLVDFIKNYK